MTRVNTQHYPAHHLRCWAVVMSYEYKQLSTKGLEILFKAQGTEKVSHERKSEKGSSTSSPGHIVSACFQLPRMLRVWHGSNENRIMVIEVWPPCFCKWCGEWWFNKYSTILRMNNESKIIWISSTAIHLFSLKPFSLFSHSFHLWTILNSGTQ